MPSEAETFWADFLRSLTRRGLRGVQLVISDAHAGLKKAVALKALYLADNSISSLSGLSELPKLEKLHVRKNKIADLSDCPELESLR